MCTYTTEHLKVSGSGKGGDGWFKLSDASVYFDHPVHAPYEHSLNIDFIDSSNSFSQRVAIELNPDDARELAFKIQELLNTDIKL